MPPSLSPTRRHHRRWAETSFFHENSPRNSLCSSIASAYLGGSDALPSPSPFTAGDYHEDVEHCASVRRGFRNSAQRLSWRSSNLDSTTLEDLQHAWPGASSLGQHRQPPPLELSNSKPAGWLEASTPTRPQRATSRRSRLRYSNVYEPEEDDPLHPSSGRDLGPIAIHKTKSTKTIPAPRPSSHFVDSTTQALHFSDNKLYVSRYRDAAVQTSRRSSLGAKAFPTVRKSMDGDDSQLQAQKPIAKVDDTSAMPKGIRFWLLMASLMSTTILASLEATIVSTALPTIVGELSGGPDFLWAVNAYFLTNTAIAPFYAQMADILGRRPPMLVAVSLFLLGSGIAGGAQDMHMLIAGRTVQGLGAGGLQMMVNLVISDLIPMRERPQYLAMSFAITAVASGLGPVFSGLIVSHATWRWVFFFSLPVGGIALILLSLFLQTKHERKSTADKFKSIDFIGHALFMPSVVSILFALTYAGSIHPWGSWNTLVPLTLGFAGFCAFVAWEASGIPKKPNIPVRVLKNRTSAAVFLIAFIHSMLSIWTTYFLPVFFQAVQLSSPDRSGVQLLPNLLPFMVMAMVGGKLLQQLGRYREMQLIVFALMIVAFGLFTLLDANSSTAFWVLVQVLEGAAAGFAAGTLLPAAQAPLEQKDVAAIVGTFSFAKAFGVSWGVTLPGTIFNNKFSELAYRITDDAVRPSFLNGGAYGHATAAFIEQFGQLAQDQIVGVYSETLKFIWQVATGICGLAFLLVFLEKHYDMKKTVKTAYGMKDAKKQKDAER